MLCGCSQASEPTEIAGAFYDLFVYEDGSALKEVCGLEDSDINDLLTSYQDEFISEIGNVLTSAGMTEYTEEDLNTQHQARQSAFSALSAAYEQEANAKEKTAVVTIETQYADETAMIEQVADDIIAKYENRTYTTEDDLDSLIKELEQDFIAAMIEGYSSLKPEADTKTVTADFVYEDNVWLPKDEVQFGADLGAAISGF